MLDETPTAPEPSKPEVLIVEDNEAICVLLKNALEKRGFQVPVFVDPTVALNYLDAAPRHLQIAIIDQNLPKLTGLRFAKELRARQPQVQLIITSGRQLSEYRSELSQLPGVNLLPKPFNLAELNRVVTAAVQAYAEAPH